MTEFMIGCDPELFLTKRDGTPLSAHGAVAGTKKAPLPVAGGAIQVDGMALEFNTDPVLLGGDFSQFNSNINSVLKELKKAVQEADGFKTARFKIAPVQDFGAEIMAATPEEARELGCDPDYCAYTGKPNPRPDGEVTFRTASGHIHVGWGADIPVEHPEHIEICCDFIKSMDAHVGLFMTIIESDPRRRELYGKAGAFRPKPYGVEYRTPSNEWLLSVAYRRVIYDLTQRAQAAMMRTEGKIEGMFRLTKPVTTEEFCNNVREIIDTGNKQAAYDLLYKRFYSGMWMLRNDKILLGNITEAYKKVTGNKEAA